MARRALRVKLQSDQSDAPLRTQSDWAKVCGGAPLRDGLSAYEWQGRNGCSSPAYANASRYIGTYDGVPVRIECRDKTFSGLGCDLRFPFERFAAELSFHRDRLPEWHAMIDRATAFLKSRQYRRNGDAAGASLIRAASCPHSAGMTPDAA